MDDEGEDPHFGNLSLQLDEASMIHPPGSDEEDEDGQLSLGLEGGLDEVESVAEGEGPIQAVESKASNDDTFDGITEKEWEDARRATYAKFVQQAIVVLNRIKAGDIPKTPAPLAKVFEDPETKFGEDAAILTAEVQTHADKLFKEAVNLENELLHTAKDGSFKKFYANKTLDALRNKTPSRNSPHRRSGGFSAAARRRGHRRQNSNAGVGTIGILLVRADLMLLCAGIGVEFLFLGVDAVARSY